MTAAASCGRQPSGTAPQDARPRPDVVPSDPGRTRGGAPVPRQGPESECVSRSRAHPIRHRSTGSAVGTAASDTPRVGLPSERPRSCRPGLTWVSRKGSPGRVHPVEWVSLEGSSHFGSRQLRTPPAPGPHRLDPAPTERPGLGWVSRKGVRVPWRAMRGYRGHRRNRCHRLPRAVSASRRLPRRRRRLRVHVRERTRLRVDRARCGDLLEWVSCGGCPSGKRPFREREPPTSSRCSVSVP